MEKVQRAPKAAQFKTEGLPAQGDDAAASSFVAGRAPDRPTVHKAAGDDPSVVKKIREGGPIKGPYRLMRRTADATAAWLNPRLPQDLKTDWIHGDAHVQQYGYQGTTSDGSRVVEGILDMDEAGPGNAGADLVRLMASIELMLPPLGIEERKALRESLAAAYQIGATTTDLLPTCFADQPPSPLTMQAYLEGKEGLAGIIQPAAEPEHLEALFRRYQQSLNSQDRAALKGAKLLPEHCGEAQLGIGSAGAQKKIFVALQGTDEEYFFLEFKPMPEGRDPEDVREAATVFGSPESMQGVVPGRPAFWVHRISSSYGEAEPSDLGQAIAVASAFAARLARAHTHGNENRKVFASKVTLRFPMLCELADTLVAATRTDYAAYMADATRTASVGRSALFANA